MHEAPKVFMSYTHDSVEHTDRVLALCNRLRVEGIDCRIDQYEQSPAEGWPRWCERQVEKSDFVLVACTETYLRRLKGEASGIGLGGTWKGHFITQELYNAQGGAGAGAPRRGLEPQQLGVALLHPSVTRRDLFPEFSLKNLGYFLALDPAHVGRRRSGTMG